jgi:hypothetical protein
MIYIPSFIKTGSGIQKLMEWGDTLTHTQDGDRSPEIQLTFRRVSNAIREASLILLS